MTRKQLEDQLLKALKVHQRAHDIAVDAVNTYLQEHPEGIEAPAQAVNAKGVIARGNIQDTVEAIMHQGAWIQDRLSSRTGLPGLPGYERSLSRKIRKATGYTL